MPPRPDMGWYNDPRIYDLKLKHLIHNGPQYLGHEHCLSNIGDYYVPPTAGRGLLLTRGKDNEVRALTNVCRHREALLVAPDPEFEEGLDSVKDHEWRRGNFRGNVIRCPMHYFTYKTDGVFLRAPQFDPQPTGCDLFNEKMKNVQGFLFRTDRNITEELASVGDHPRWKEYSVTPFDLKGWKLDRLEVKPYKFSYETFIEVYLDVLHVSVIHPTSFDQLVDISTLDWWLGEKSSETNWSIQFVGWNKNARKASTKYAAYREILKEIEGGDPKFGAIWMTYYPNMTFEWYPYGFVASTVIPTGINTCMNVTEFYYPEDILRNYPELPKLHQDAYFETAWEDEILCERTECGRKVHYVNHFRSLSTGPSHPHLEKGLDHYWEYLHRELSSELARLKFAPHD